MGSEVPIDDPKSSPVLNARRRRQFFRFSLRFMLLLVAAVAALLGMRAQYREHFARQRRIVERVAVLVKGSSLVDGDWSITDLGADGSRVGFGVVEFRLQDARTWPTLFYPAGDLVEVVGADLSEPPGTWPVRPQAGRAAEAVPLDEVIAEISQLSSLGYVYIRLPGLNDRHVAQLCRLRDMSSLCLISDQLTDVALQEICSHMTGLVHLEISSPRLTDRGTGALAKLERLSKLKIESPRITGAGLESLGSVYELELTSSSLSHRGFRALVACQELTRLTIADATITSDETACLAAMPSLGCLQLSHAQVADSAWRELWASRSLEALELYRMPSLSAEAVAAIAASHLRRFEWFSPERLTEGSVRQLAKIGTLRSLLLDRAKFSEDDLRALGARNDLRILMLINSSLTKS